LSENSRVRDVKTSKLLAKPDIATPSASAIRATMFAGPTPLPSTHGISRDGRSIIVAKQGTGSNKQHRIVAQRFDFLKAKGNWRPNWARFTTRS
jgi:hypothetical protein